MDHGIWNDYFDEVTELKSIWRHVPPTGRVMERLARDWNVFYDQTLRIWRNNKKTCFRSEMNTGEEWNLYESLTAESGVKPTTSQVQLNESW